MNNYRLLNQIMKYFSWCRTPQFLSVAFMEPNDPTTAGRGAGVGPVIHILRKGGGGDVPRASFPGSATDGYGAPSVDSPLAAQ